VGGLVGRCVVHWWLMWVGGLMWVGRLLGGSRCVGWGLGLHYLTTLSLRPFVLRRPMCAVWCPSGDNADSVASGGAAVLEWRLGHHITTFMRRSAVLANATAGKVTQAEVALQLLSPTAQMGACCVRCAHSTPERTPHTHFITRVFMPPESDVVLRKSLWLLCMCCCRAVTLSRSPSVCDPLVFPSVLSVVCCPCVTYNFSPVLLCVFSSDLVCADESTLMPVCVAIANGGRIGELKRVLLALHRRLRKSQGVGMRTAVSGGPCFVLCCVCGAWGDLWGEGGWVNNTDWQSCTAESFA